MDRFLCMQAFVRVAETRSFAEAARQLGVTQSVISHRVSQLERCVQSSLFHRSTRSVRLSETGAGFFNECAELVSHTDSALERMRALKGSPSGRLRLQIVPGLALDDLGAAIRDFMGLYPNIDIELIADEVPANPIDKGYDVSLQILRTGAGTLIERPLFPVHRVFCASPKYLAMHGEPTTPAELAQHPLGVYSEHPARDRWTFRRGNEEFSLQLSPKFRCSSMQVLREFSLAAGGITCLPTYVCGKELSSGALSVVLPQYELPRIELSALYPVTHRGALKVKLFVDFIARRYSGDLPWDEALRKMKQSGREVSRVATKGRMRKPARQ